MKHGKPLFVAVWALQFALCLSVRAGELRFDWALADTIAEGILYTQSEFTIADAQGLRCPHYRGFSPEQPRHVRRYAVRIDTRERALRFAATERATQWGEPMPGKEGQAPEPLVIRTVRETTLGFARALSGEERKVWMAVNASPWSPFRSGLTHLFADRLGLTMAEGILVCPPDGRRPSLVIDADGRPDVRTVPNAADVGDLRVAVSGFAFCLVDGEPAARDTVLHPRTGFGLCPERRYLVVLVVDGRQDTSQGATVREVGEWLRYYGAWNGLNMDGGGSTTLVLRNPETDDLEVRNRPGGGQRKVGSNLGVYRQKLR